jgi:hypothetical protein
MNEWGVVTVLAALTAMGATVVRPLIRLNVSITRLTALIDGLAEDLADLSGRNAQSHGRLWERSGEQDRLLGEHDRRLAVLEATKGGDRT